MYFPHRSVKRTNELIHLKCLEQVLTPSIYSIIVSQIIGGLECKTVKFGHEECSKGLVRRLLFWQNTLKTLWGDKTGDRDLMKRMVQFSGRGVQPGAEVIAMKMRRWIQHPLELLIYYWIRQPRENNEDTRWYIGWLGRRKCQHLKWGNSSKETENISSAFLTKPPNTRFSIPCMLSKWSWLWWRLWNCVL